MTAGSAAHRGLWSAAMSMVTAACAFSPVAHRIKAGEEAYVVVVGEGVDHHTDLFAVPAGGNTMSQLTFTALIEKSPVLTPSGVAVAFLRMRDTNVATPHEVVIMNVVGGGERVLPVPPAAGQPELLAWSDSGTTLYIRTDHGLWQVDATKTPVVMRPVAATDTAVADSTLTSWLGQPRFARVIACGNGLCIIGPKNDTTPLAPNGRDAMRWGSDSVGWIEGNGIVVRSLGPGRERRVTWQNPPEHPREGSYAPGPPNPT